MIKASILIIMTISMIFSISTITKTHQLPKQEKIQTKNFVKRMMEIEKMVGEISKQMTKTRQTNTPMIYLK
jgi:hypothetical protein